MFGAYFLLKMHSFVLSLSFIQPAEITQKEKTVASPTVRAQAPVKVHSHSDSKTTPVSVKALGQGEITVNFPTTVDVSKAPTKFPQSFLVRGAKSDRFPFPPPPEPPTAVSNVDLPLPPPPDDLVNTTNPFVSSERESINPFNVSDEHDSVSHNNPFLTDMIIEVSPTNPFLPVERTKSTSTAVVTSCSKNPFESGSDVRNIPSPKSRPAPIPVLSSADTVTSAVHPRSKPVVPVRSLSQSPATSRDQSSTISTGYNKSDAHAKPELPMRAPGHSLSRSTPPPRPPNSPARTRPSPEKPKSPTCKQAPSAGSGRSISVKKSPPPPPPSDRQTVVPNTAPAREHVSTKTPSLPGERTIVIVSFLALFRSDINEIINRLHPCFWIWN